MNEVPFETGVLSRLSCWVDEREGSEKPDLAILPARVDVAVIGAGYTGLSAALEAAKQGASVAVLEAAEIGWGASSRNGGMVLSGLKLGPRELVARFGFQTARQMDAASIAAIDHLAGIVADEAIECSFARSGHLALASKASHYTEYQRDAEVLQQFRRNVRMIPKESLGDEIGSDTFFGALLDEASASLQPAQYVAGLARAAQRAGATICERAVVERIAAGKQNGTSYRLTTARGHVTAKDVILATGGYTGASFPALRKRVIPIGSYVIATEPLTPKLADAVSPRKRMMFDSKHFLHYFRLTPDQRMLFGGRASFVPESERTIRESAQELRREMLRVFPQLRAAQVERAWGGTVDFTFDMLPHAGRLNGMYYSVGYAGHGVAMATYLGAQIARVIAGAPADKTLLDREAPRAPLGLYNGVPWFLPFAGAWLKFMDAVR